MTTKADWLASRCPDSAPQDTTMDRDQIVRSLDWLLAHLHMSLATNKAHDPEIAELADRLAAWWDKYQSAAPLPSLSFYEQPKTTTGDETCWMGTEAEGRSAPTPPVKTGEG